MRRSSSAAPPALSLGALAILFHNPGVMASPPVQMLLALIGIALVVVACRQPTIRAGRGDRGRRPGDLPDRAQQRGPQPDPDGVAARRAPDRGLRPPSRPARRRPHLPGAGLPGRRRDLAAGRGRLARRRRSPTTSRCSPSSTSGCTPATASASGSRWSSRRPRVPPATSESRCPWRAAGSARPTWSTTRSSTTTARSPPASYRQWLDQLAVAYVAVPATKLDFASVDEAKLIATGPPLPPQVWSNADWKLYQVSRLPARWPATPRWSRCRATRCGCRSRGPGWCRSRSGGRTTWPSSTAPSRCRCGVRAHGCLSKNGDWTLLHARRRGHLRADLRLRPDPEPRSSAAAPAPSRAPERTWAGQPTVTDVRRATCGRQHQHGEAGQGEDHADQRRGPVAAARRRSPRRPATRRARCRC